MKTEFNSKKRKSSGVSSLAIKGELTVQQSIEFKNQLTSHLNSKGDLDLSLEDIDMIDVTSIQLIYGFKKKLEDIGRSMNIHMPKNAAVSNLIQNTGLALMISQSNK